MSPEADFIKSVDIPAWIAGAKNYKTRLLDLISVADSKNLEILRTVYRDEVEAYLSWRDDK